MYGVDDQWPPATKEWKDVMHQFRRIPSASHSKDIEHKGYLNERIAKPHEKIKLIKEGDRQADKSSYLCHSKEESKKFDQKVEEISFGESMAASNNTFVLLERERIASM